MKFMGSIAKAFTLSLCIIANTHLAYAQTASILPPAKTTFFDSNGNPLTAGKVDFYIPGTTTRKTTWQDAAETIPNTNPVTLDAAGRALILGSGSYRQVVKDKLGNLIWDQVTSSTGSGGGGSTSIGDGNNVGTILPWSGFVAPSSYVFAYGQELSRASFPVLLGVLTQVSVASCTSGSPTLTTITDTSQLNIGAKVEASCIPSGSTIISKTSSSVTLNNNATVSVTLSATFFPYGNGNGVTTFNVPDYRGKAFIGRCNMGGSSCTNVTTAFYGTDPNSIGGNGGRQFNTLHPSDLPPYTPTGTITNGAITSTFTGAPVTGINTTIGGSGNFASGSFGPQAIGGTVASTQASSTFVGNPQGGTSTAFSILPPSITTNYIIKTTPNYLSTSLNVVTSLGNQTGDIVCTVGIECSDNSIGISTTLPSGITASFMTLVNPIISDNSISNSSLAQSGAATFKGNPTSSTANVQDFTIGGLSAISAPDQNLDYIPIVNHTTGTIQKITPGQIASSAVAGVTSVNTLSGVVAVNGAANVVTTSTSPRTITANATLATSDYMVICDATSGAITSTLPTPTTSQVYAVTKKDSSANACTIAGSINGTSSFALTKQYETLNLQWNGVSWSIL